MKNKTVGEGCVLVFLVLLYSCVPMHYEPSAELKAQWQQIAERNKATTEEVRTSVVPDDFQEKIESFLDDTLKDPGSKVVEYVDQPIGSIVCGMLNAKNSYGGYTGKSPFVAYFDHEGGLMDLQMQLSDEVFLRCDTLECDAYALKVFFERCRFRG